jgi:RND family efflux transporter MFP subunit
MKNRTRKRMLIALGPVVLGGAALAWTVAAGKTSTAAAANAKADSRQQAALTVAAVQPQQVDWPVVLTANGDIAAWQETAVSSELGGLQLAEVRVNVGDVVKRGQVLARFESDTVAADVAQQEAGVELARAALSEAQANAEGARSLASSGVLSAQQTKQYLTAELTAQANLKLAEARLNLDHIHLRQTLVRAPDDGVISARTATLGTVVGQGAELFRLIRQGRLEWRANVLSADLVRVKPGARVRLATANGVGVEGTVRAVGPTVSALNRSAIVYVDLPPSALRAGMFATGRFDLGHAPALAVAQSAILTRNGNDYVYQIGANGRVTQTPVTVGRRQGDLVELLSGVTPASRLVGAGSGFLSDGDIVRVALPASTSLAAK